MKLQQWKVLDRNQLKILAIIAMTLDHTAIAFLPAESFLWYVFRIIGRITFPLMTYMLAEGFTYTHDLKKYIGRLFWFSLVSWFTFSFFEAGSLLPVRLMTGNVTDYYGNFLYIAAWDKTLCISKFSVLTGLLCGLLSLTVLEKTQWKLPFRLLAVFGLILVSFNCDWGWYSVLFVLCFFYLRRNKLSMWIVFCAVSLLYIFDVIGSVNLFAPYLCGGFRPYRLGIILVPILLGLFYNGQKGKGGRSGKWFFYVYYPAHQVILAVLHLFFAA